LFGVPRACCDRCDDSGYGSYGDERKRDPSLHEPKATRVAATGKAFVSDFGALPTSRLH
jgi:hypothetical protein